MAEDNLVELIDIEKEFSGTKALKGVSLSLRRGEVHGLLGENGAGKSTLIKILTGVYSPSAGRIILEGKPVRVGSPMDAHKLGLGAVYQDAELVAGFTVAENVVLGNEPGGFVVSRRSIEDEARGILNEIGISLDVKRLARRLSAAETQLVTLATLFHRRYKLIVLDEPTARLSATEVDMLFDLIQRFKDQGITIVYISHRLEEIKRICDRATILRGGLISATLERDEISEDRVTELMVDRTMSELEISNPGYAREDVVLEVNELATDILQPLSFTLRAGEVLGITGPVGGGMEEVGRALSGIKHHAGTVTLGGRKLSLASPTGSIAAGIALIPEDRRRQALFPNLSVAENICLPVLQSLTRIGMINRSLMMSYADSVMARLDVQPHHPRKAVKFFSGGNQQKAVIGKWLEAKAKIYIFMEPTAGVDVGAIREIYETVLRLAEAGASVIVITSAIKEIMSLSETVFVVHDGQLVHKARTHDCTYDQLLALALKGRQRDAA